MKFYMYVIKLKTSMNNFKDLRQQRDFQLSTIAEMNNEHNDEINKI